MSEINTLTVNGKAYRLADAAVREQVGQMAEQVGQMAGQVGQMAEQLDACAIMAEACADAIAIDHGSDNKLRVMNLYGKTTQTGAPTPDAPVEPVSVGDRGSIDIRVTGKNLISLPYASGYMEKNGLTFAVQEDGSVIVNGTATADTAYNVTPKIMNGVRVGETYTLSGCPKDGGYSKYFIRIQTTGGVFDDSGAGKKVTSVDVSDRCVVYIQIRSGIVADNMIFRPQLELGATATEYETPKTQQTCTIGGVVLRGIPVSKNGNYTDGNGQMWLTDEIDLVNRRLIRRVGYIVFDGAENWLHSTKESLKNTFYIKADNLAPRKSIPNAFSSHYKFINGGVGANGEFTTSDAVYFYDDTKNDDLETWKQWVSEQSAAGYSLTVAYGLAEPVEEALSADVAAAFEGLHTNKPNTTIWSSSGAEVKVSYTADTKLYIDNKFTELQNAILASGANI